MNSIGQRIKYLRAQYKVTQQELSNATGISRGNISHYEKDDFFPSNVSLRAIAAFFKINPYWLLKGEGPMGLSEFTLPQEHPLEEYPHKDPDGLTRSTILAEFSKNYKQALKLSFLNINQLHALTSIPIERLSAFENSECLPTPYELLQLQKSNFAFSMAILLSGTVRDEYHKYVNYSVTNIKEIKARISFLLEQYNLKSVVLSVLTGVATSEIDNCLAGLSVPSIDTLSKIAQIFNVSIEWLLYDKDLTQNSISGEELNIIKIYKNASNDDKNLILSFLKKFKPNDNKS